MGKCLHNNACPKCNADTSPLQGGIKRKWNRPPSKHQPMLRCWLYLPELGHFRLSSSTHCNKGTFPTQTQQHLTDGTDPNEYMTRTTCRRRRPHKWQNRSRAHSEIYRRSPETSDEDFYGSGCDVISSFDSDSESSDSDSETERGHRPIISFGTCAGQNVSSKLCRKIIDHRYTDLALFLPSAKATLPTNFTV